MLGFLNQTVCGGDMKCPKCHVGLDVEWTTEYGDAMPGEETAKCPNCGATFSFNVEVTTTYTVIPTSTMPIETA